MQESHNRLRKAWAAAANQGAAALTPEQQEAVVAEHCRVFQLNNNIVRGFRTGWLDWPRAFARTVPVLVQLSVAVGAAICAYAVMRIWGW